MRLTDDDIDQATAPAQTGGVRLTDADLEQQSQPYDPVKTLKNLVPSTMHVLKSAGQAVIHPVDTVKGIDDLAGGGLWKLAPQSFVDWYLKHPGVSDEDKQTVQRMLGTADAFGQEQKGKYGSLDSFKRTLEERPAEMLADASVVAGGAAGALRAAGAAKAADIAGKVSDLTNPINAVTKPVGKALEKVGDMKDTASQVANQTRNDILDRAGENGYMVPRSAIKPGVMSDILNRFGGKEGIKQTVQAKNQPMTNALAAEDIGLPANADLSGELLRKMRQQEGMAYEVAKHGGEMLADENYFADLDKLRQTYGGTSLLESRPGVKDLIDKLYQGKFTSEEALKTVRDLRERASGDFRSGNYDLARAQLGAAQALDGQLARHLEVKLGSKAFMDYQVARQRIAKLHDVEDALDINGNVDATVLGRKLENDDPLSGNLKKIAEFAAGNRQYAKVPSGVTPTGGLFEPLVYGGVGAAATMDPVGMAAALIPLIGKPLARRLAISRASAPTPSYAGPVGGFLNDLNTQPALAAGQLNAFRNR